MQAQRGIAPAIAYPLVLLARDRGERANFEAALPIADEHSGVPVDELAPAYHD